MDVKRFPDYTAVVSEPMDFATMKDKAERGQYRDPASVYADFMRVFNNSRLYNPPGSDVYYMATVLQVRRSACQWQHKQGGITFVC